MSAEKRQILTGHQSNQPNQRQGVSAFQRMPPHDIEAEMATLGAMFFAKEPGIAAEMLRPADFYRESHQMIFEAMTHLDGKGTLLDIVTIKDELIRIGKLDRIGGVPYLMQLADYVPTVAALPYYAGIVQEKAVRRRLIEAATITLSLAYGEVNPDSDEPEMDAAAVAGKAEELIFAAAKVSGTGRNGSNKGWEAPPALIAESVAKIESMYHAGGNVLPGLPTGLYALDNILSGLQPSDLIVIGARPSIGKTALVVSIAQSVAIAGNGVGVFSVEMKARKLMDRMLSSESEIDSWKLRRGLLSHDEWARFTEAQSRLYDIPLRIDGSSYITVADMRSRARRLAGEIDLKLLIVDYLQIVAGSSSRMSEENMRIKIMEIIRGLKDIARELDIPVIALSQVNRAVENRPDKRPQMSDLMESGQIEAEADVIATLYRASYYDRGDRRSGDGIIPEDAPDVSNLPDEMEIIICKGRDGPTGTVKVEFVPQFTKVRNLPGTDESGNQSNSDDSYYTAYNHNHNSSNTQGSGNSHPEPAVPEPHTPPLF